MGEFYIPNSIAGTYTIKQCVLMDQRALKNVHNCLNTYIYSYLETSTGQSSNVYLNGDHFFKTGVN